jgi:glutamine cyclotransferase
VIRVAALAATAVLAVLALPVLRSAGAGAQVPAVPAPSSKAPVDTYRIVRSYPHDSEAFTQGLEFVDGFLYEGTGLNGRSSIRKIKLDTGDVIQRRAVGAEYFGEGITIWDDRLIELTWQSQVALVYDRRTFQPIKTFSYGGEGWGLTHDAHSLIMSDGTSAIRFLDPVTFRERRRVTVTDGGVPITALNELEVVKGEVWANVWTTDFIARIHPETGRVTGWIDLRNLLPVRERAGDAVLNGIAYDGATDRVFVTGKLWPRLFEIQLVRRPTP